MEIIAVYSDTYKKPINPLWENVEIVIFKVRGTYSLPTVLERVK
jgi:hypothetical protein